MNDTIGLTYDDEAAVRFASATTGLDERVVAAVLRSKDRYLLGLGILPSEAAEALGGDAPDAIRATQPALFPSEHMVRRYVDQPLERAFVVGDCGINEHAVRTVLRANDEYMRRRRILE